MSNRVVDWMVEAEDVARSIFGDEVSIEWRLNRYEDVALWMDIVCPPSVPVERARELLDRFDSSYWLAVGTHRPFSVTTQFR